MTRTSPGSRPRRGPVVLLALVGALAVLGTTTPTWLTADLGAALVADRTVEVSGATAAPVVPATALVALAAAGATSIARRAGRVVAGLLLVAAGTTSLGGALAVLVDPGRAARPAVEDATGGTVVDAVVSTTVWPWLVLPAAVLVGVAGVLVLAARWDGARRFDPAPPQDARPPADPDPNPHPDPASDWDSLSRGDDPTAR